MVHEKQEHKQRAQDIYKFMWVHDEKMDQIKTNRYLIYEKAKKWPSFPSSLDERNYCYVEVETPRRNLVDAEEYSYCKSTIPRHDSQLVFRHEIDAIGSYDHEQSHLFQIMSQEYTALLGHSDEEEMNKIEFQKFVTANARNPKYVNKYVVFVYGVLQAVGDTEIELVKKIYKEFGNVHMYVGNASEDEPVVLIESPELH